MTVTYNNEDLRDYTRVPAQGIIEQMSRYFVGDEDFLGNIGIYLGRVNIGLKSFFRSF
jgi:hypothetical protein